ncbi:MAG: hypothetical protein RL230_2453 [Pseudomonadota bacterium]|jgi:hypothetical protein
MGDFVFFCFEMWRSASIGFDLVTRQRVGQSAVTDVLRLARTMGALHQGHRL